MKRYGNIYEKIASVENLKEAHRMARADKKFYREVKMVDSDPEPYLGIIRKMLLDESYVVSPYRISHINDRGKEREIAKLPYFPDRIIQWAILLQVGDIFEDTFCYHTCASLSGRGISRGLRITKKYLRNHEKETKYCLKIDIHHFYQSIDRTILKKMLRKKFKDERLLRLLDEIIESSPNKTGIPIGSYLSQYLANFYLSYFDHWLKEGMHLKYVIRYMDDIVILLDSKKRLHGICKQIRYYLEMNLNVSMKENYQVFPVSSRGVDFLGFVSYKDHTLLRKTTKVNMERKMNRIRHKQDKGILISHHEWSSINSYAGWISQCDGYNLFVKYFIPISESYNRYYFDKIKGGNTNHARQWKGLRWKGMGCSDSCA
jgi:RNA-directed DNA polymerase